MHIDFSAPKAHTSLFSQVAKEDDWELNYAQTKQGSQTINLAAMQSSEPQTNYAQINEDQPADSDIIALSAITAVDEVKTELVQ